METNRLETFSDGVFAIAITLLVLEIKVPPPETAIGAELLHLWPSYLAYGGILTVIALKGKIMQNRKGGNGKHGPALPGRRTFLGAGVGLAAASLLSRMSASAQSDPADRPADGDSSPTLKGRRRLGTLEVSAVGIGVQNMSRTYQQTIIMLQGKILRVARPTDLLAQVVHFYTEGLGLQILDRFENHEGFDGVMVGIPGEVYHFEFIHQRGHMVGRAPTQDNSIVYYLPNLLEWQQAIERMKNMGYEPVKSYNPYWDIKGVTFEDPDGYRVVLQNAEWSL